MSSKSTFSNSTSISYALALYELAKENSDLNKIENEIQSLNELLTANKNFNEMILSPTITKEEKKNVIFAIAEQNNFSKIVKNFLGLVAIKNRLFYLKKILESFLNLASNKKGELIAKLTSSKELSQHEREKIENELSKDFKAPLKVEYKHDPKLIAGLAIQVGSIMVDTSIKTKLKKLEKNMLEA